MRNKYWSSSKFADWIRGTTRITHGTFEEWDDWEALAKKHSIRYWVAKELLQYLQDVVYFPYDCYRNVRWYLENRFRARTHVLPTRLKVGQWCDLDMRILHACFEGLVDYVEVELGHEGPYRDPQRGLDHLKWAKALIYDESWGYRPDSECYGKPAFHAEAAKEAEILYRWWKARPDREWAETVNEELNLEEQWRVEDNDMLIRLMGVRESLWT